VCYTPLPIGPHTAESKFEGKTNYYCWPDELSVPFKVHYKFVGNNTQFYLSSIRKIFSHHQGHTGWSKMKGRKNFTLASKSEDVGREKPKTLSLFALHFSFGGFSVCLACGSTHLTRHSKFIMAINNVCLSDGSLFSAKVLFNFVVYRLVLKGFFSQQDQDINRLCPAPPLLNLVLWIFSTDLATHIKKH
jgi:hypothetical protein